MNRTYAEPAFGAVVCAATAVALVAYVLGLLLPPGVALVVGVALVGAGAAALVPRGDRAMAAVVGTVAVLVGGGAVPRAVAGLDGVADELSLTVAFSGVVLLAAFVVLRLVAFGQNPPRTA